MTRAYLVRHGTTDWTDAGRLQGQSGAGLNARGRAEARAAADLLARESVSRVVTSPLARARETAAVVAERTASPLTVEAAWQERSFGALEGEPASAAFAAHPELHPKDAAFDPDAAGDGESARDVVERVTGQWPPADGAVVVTHETPLRVAAALAEGVDPVAALSRLGFVPGAVLAVADGTWRRLHGGDDP